MDDFVSDVLEACHGTSRVYVKVLSANDTGKTGSHQFGPYISKSYGGLWVPAIKGTNTALPVTLQWRVANLDEPLVTHSQLKWYGGGTRSEFRLTRFDRGFPYQDTQYTGSLFVMVPVAAQTFDIFLVEQDDHIDAVLGDLGLSPAHLPVIWPIERVAPVTDRFIADVLDALRDDFPSTATMAEKGRELARLVHPSLTRAAWDDQLLSWIDMEYRLYQAVEDFFLRRELSHIGDTESFLRLANSVMNRRKSRAGKSLEHHIAAILSAANIPFTAQARTEHKNRADFILPSDRAYHDFDFPAGDLVFLAAKTTARDRWRQILPEADRIPVKHLLTLQQSLSPDQVHQIALAHVLLVVPKRYHPRYPGSDGIIWSIQSFVKMLQERRDARWVMLHW